jgi:hypothetical protein
MESKGLENSYSASRTALWNHNLPSGRLIIDFSEFDEAMFQGVERPCELIFFFLGIRKSELVEVAKVLFYVGEWA